MQAVLERALEDNEVASDSLNPDRFITVLERPGTSTVDELLADGAFLEHVKASYKGSGAVLLRGLPIKDTSQAETLLLKLGVNFDDNYLGGASPRSRLSEHFFTSTEAPGSYVISFHTEMCYLKQRPQKIFFYCITEPKSYGETPVFDCARIFSRLSSATRLKIERHGMIYQRYLGDKKPRIFNVYKTWRDSLQANTREEAEAACRQQGLDFTWQANGGLITQAHMPGFILDPQTGQKCISLTLYNGEAAPYDLSKFSHRLNTVVRLGLSTLIRAQYAKKNVFMRTLWGDGAPISAVETREMIDAAWASSNVFKWKQGDLLILDNIRRGHGRLNVNKPRKIAAALGDTYKI